MCGPPPCHGPNPKPPHWHCDEPTASAENTTYVESYYVSDSANGAEQVATSSSNFWMYVAAGAALTAMLVGIAFRKKVRIHVDVLLSCVYYIYIYICPMLEPNMSHSRTCLLHTYLPRCVRAVTNTCYTAVWASDSES